MEPQRQETRRCPRPRAYCRHGHRQKWQGGQGRVLQIPRSEVAFTWFYREKTENGGPLMLDIMKVCSNTTTHATTVDAVRDIHSPPFGQQKLSDNGSRVAVRTDVASVRHMRIRSRFLCSPSCWRNVNNIW